MGRWMMALGVVLMVLTAAVPASALTRDDAVAQALQQNPRLLAAKAAELAESGKILKESSDWFMRWRGGFTYQNEPYGTGGRDRIYNQRWWSTFTQPVYTFGHISHKVKKARLQTEAVAAAANVTGREIAHDAALAFDEVLLRQEVVKSRGEMLTNSRGDLQKVKARFSEQKATELEVKQAEIKVAGDENELSTAETQLAVARQRLNFLRGAPLEEEVAADGTLDDMNVNVAQLRSAFSISKHPRLRQNEREIAAVSEGKISAQRAYLPFVIAEATWQHNDPQQKERAPGTDGDTGSFAQRGHSIYLGLYLDFPLGQRGVEAMGRKREAIGELTKRRYMKAHISRGLDLQAAEGFSELEAAIRSRKIADQRIAAAAMNVKNMEAGFKEGVFTGVQVSEAERGLVEARLGRLQAAFDVRVAVAKIEDAAGVSLSRIQPPAGN